VSPARAAAFDVLLRVLRGAYASDLLIQRTSQLSSRDAGLASHIVFGVLRFRAQLDFLIDHYAGHPAKTEPGLRAALWMGIFQLRYLDRIPRHAAVDESVELAKQGGRRFAAGFVNAILRKVNRDPIAWPSKSVELSCPAWLLESWTRQFGAAQAEAIAREALREPGTWVRTAQPAPNLEPAGLPGASRVTHGNPPSGARIQDLGSQSIVPLLDLAPGLVLLDLCAAPGNKTAQALEFPILAFAGDLHLHRLRTVPPAAHRVALDASKPLPFSTRFDRVLADVPCSGTGTLSRNPEIKWRLEPSNLGDLHRLQVAILTNALAVLKPAGRLVYSTCSLEEQENHEVVAEALHASPGHRLVREMQRLPGRDPGDGFYAAVLTSN
jgi:16S rRNA (cytosine967-C5)-methyltransferase